MDAAAQTAQEGEYDSMLLESIIIENGWRDDFLRWSPLGSMSDINMSIFLELRGKQQVQLA